MTASSKNLPAGRQQTSMRKRKKIASLDDIPVEWILVFCRKLCYTASSDCIHLAAGAAAKELGVEREDMNPILAQALLERSSHPFVRGGMSI